jgi:hypothetical protein
VRLRKILKTALSCKKLDHYATTSSPREALLKATIQRSISQLSLLIVIATTTQTARGAILIPNQLSQSDRVEALRILGIGSSSKLLSGPYPLGGYLGFELGVSVENLPVDDIGRLGARLPTPQQSVSFPKFSIGKGLYNDIDVFLQFTPYTRQDELSQFGGILRWSLHEAKFLPITTAILLHFNSGNIGNILSTRSYGIDLVSGITSDEVALYAGVGFIEATGSFIGGTSGITDSGQVESESVSGSHSLLGASIHFSKIFVALQIDRYSVPVFSTKIGVRF